MKALTILLITLASTVAIAAEKPLISKSNSTGFVPAEWARSETCDVYQNRVLITRVYGAEATRIEHKETRNILIKSNLQALTKAVLAEKVEVQPNLLCDGPSTVTTILGNEVLFSTGGCGSDRKERVGPLSSALREIVNTYCPVTHDFKQP
jgi:hypothetical protein